jgi:hypothetical protein
MVTSLRVATVLIVDNTFYCADAPAKTSGIPTDNDRIDKFVAPKAPPPFFCPSP